ncbi:MAG: hypothetical protein ACK44C_06415, partial [Polaromonas sp.]
TANDRVGNTGITALNNGNYLVRTANWGQGGLLTLGAVTWGSGTAGVSGAVSATNSLVGSKRDDNVGIIGITALSNGNYVVSSNNWNKDATTTRVGAVTWGSGTGGTIGAVSATNSLVGSKADDSVGNGGITALTNGNYVVRSPNFDGQRGAVWLVAGPASAAEMINASSGTANVNPALLANAAGAGTTVTL